MGPVDQSSFRPFQRPPTRLGDPHSRNLNRASAGDYALGLRRRKPGADVEAFPPAARILVSKPSCRHASLPVSLLLPAYRLKDAAATTHNSDRCRLQKGLRRNQSGHRGPTIKLEQMVLAAAFDY